MSTSQMTRFFGYTVSQTDYNALLFILTKIVFVMIEIKIIIMKHACVVWMFD